MGEFVGDLLIEVCWHKKIHEYFIRVGTRITENLRQLGNVR